MNLAEILERDPILWDDADLETVITDLRARGEAFALAEAQAGITGKKVRTKKPTFTKSRQLQVELPDELKDLEIEL
jgi:hypothetical protein